MDGNVNTENDQAGQMQPPFRRPYKRISLQQWEAQKDRIQALYIEQDKSLAEVVQIMKDLCGFEAGEKQFKRKTEDWGFVKNIPNREMVKMVKKRHRREEEHGKETVFKRTRNGNDYVVVAPAKLDRFQRRNGLDQSDLISISSAMPSNIDYGTPSNCRSISTPVDADLPVDILRRSCGQVQELLDSNSEEVNKILGQILNKPQFRSSNDRVRRLGYTGACMAFEERFKEASMAFRADSVQVAASRGRRYWVSVCLDYSADLMDAASHSSCSQTISLRFTQTLSRRLMIERLEFIILPPEEQSMDDFRRTVSYMVSTTSSWTEVIALQHALKRWEPILGTSHPSLAIIRNRLDEHNNYPGATIEDMCWGNYSPEAAPPLRPIYMSLLKAGIPSDDILELAPLPELPKEIIDLGLKAKLQRIRRGRSQAYLGGYFSFLGQFSKAEEAFQESKISLQAESCVEIKLHRMLWHCEHYTRAKNWDEVGTLLVEAHKIFMEQETASTFVISHFPERFRLLCKAVATRLSIDVAVHDSDLHDETEPSKVHSRAATPQAPSPVLEVERLFPLRPDDHSAIDVDAWRQFITFQSPPAFSPLSIASPQPRMIQPLLASP